jgi:hypothetical protein
MKKEKKDKFIAAFDIAIKSSAGGKEHIQNIDVAPIRLTPRSVIENADTAVLKKVKKIFKEQYETVKAELKSREEQQETEKES